MIFAAMACLLLELADMATILVIDESQHRAVDICTGLIKAGHQVAAVLPSAFELIKRIEEIKPDIHYLDRD